MNRPVFSHDSGSNLKRMIEELRKLVETRLSEAPGLVAMVISDLEGVPVLQAQVAGANNQVCPPTQFYYMYWLFTIKDNYKEGCYLHAHH